VSIPLAVIFVFVFEMGVLGLWIAMAVGISLQAIFYSRLVLVTNWQAVANEAQLRIETEQAKIHLDSFNSIASYGSYQSSSSQRLNSLDTSNQSFMRARD